MELVPGGGCAFTAVPASSYQPDYWPTFPGKPGWAGSSPGKPLGAAPVPIIPGVEVLGTPGWLMPAPMPVVVVDAPPGAELMPAAAGLAGAPTGGLVPTPGVEPVWGAAPAPCALRQGRRAGADHGYRDERGKMQFVSHGGSSNVGRHDLDVAGFPPFLKTPHRPITLRFAAR
jgi:hypothetical protein